MVDESTSGGLSASEEAYFSSGGETEIVADPALVVEPGAAAVVDPQIDPAPVDIESQAEQARDEKGKFVPHGALHAEREERKKLQTHLEELRTKHAVLEDRWNTILKVNQTQEQVQANTPPNPEEDIFAYAKWQGEQMKALQEKVDSRDVAERQHQQIAEQDREIWSHWSQSAQSFAAEKQDFGDAVKFLSDARSNQLKAMAAVDENFGNEAGVLNQINAELKSIVAAARAKGQNPASVVYDLAKAYGFTAPKPAVDPAANGLTEKLAQLDAAQNASRTLAASPGGNAGDPLSPEAIASMSNAEFEAWMKSPENARRLEKMMGG